MPLLMGTWSLFVDGIAGQLVLSNLDASARFSVTVPPPIPALLVGSPPLDPALQLTGGGFWNERSRTEIAFTVAAWVGTPVFSVALTFTEPRLAPSPTTPPRTCRGPFSGPTSTCWRSLTIPGGPAVCGTSAAP